MNNCTRRRPMAVEGRRSRDHLRRRCRLETLERRQLLAANVLFSDSFEAGQWAGKWVEDSQNDWFTSTQRSTDGSSSAEVDGRATNATLTLSEAVDLSDYSSAELTFDWLIESGFDSGEYLALDISTDNGATWQSDVLRLNGNSSPENNWQNETVELTPYLTRDLLVRLRSLVSRSSEDANVDNVKITAFANQSPTANAGLDVIRPDAGANGDEFVMLSGSGSDPDGEIVSYEWMLDGAIIGTTAEIAPTLPVGTSTLTLKVTDNDGASASDTVDVTINAVDMRPVKVFIMAGQSNMTGTGRAENLDPEWNVRQDDVWMWLDHNMDGGQWTTVEPGHGGSTHAPYPDEAEGLSRHDGKLLVGPELGLAKTLSDAYPDHRIALIKHGAGGRNLDTQFNPDNPGPPTSLEHMWSGMLAKSDEALSVLAATGQTYEVAGFFFDLGGGDSRNIYSHSSDPAEFEAGRLEAMARSERYADNLTSFIGAVRDEYDSDLPFAMVRITDEIPPDLLVHYPGAELVRQAQIDVAANTPGVEHFLTTDITLRDAVHFDAMGQIEYGTRFANTYFNIIETGNQTPTANAGLDQSLSDDDGTGSELVTLEGSGNDPDGSIASYEWTQGATVLGDTANINPSLSVGTHTLTLTVTDNEGATASDTVVVVVEANRGPSAEAGSNQSVSDADGSGDQAVTLTGSGSDPDGSVASYRWTEGTNVLGNTASISPSLSVGTHTLTLTVTDNGGATDSDDVVVTIAANQGPTANAGDDKTITDADDNGSETISLTGSGSDTDGSIVAYQWTEGSTLLGNTATISPSLSVGTHVLTLKVSDNGGASATDTVTVVVEAAPSGPNLSHGDIASVGSSWQTVTLDKSYTSMVVVATPRYNIESGPGVVRISNVTSNSFDVRVDNVGSSAFSGGVHYVAVEEGVYDEAGQFKLEAVKYSEAETSRKNGWLIDSASYQQAYTNPVVVGQVMSANDPDWSVFWASSSSRTSPPTSSQLNIGKHVAEDPDTTRATETVGYIVIEATQDGTIEGLPFVSGVGADTVRGVGNGTYQYSYTAMPNAKAAILSTAGMDGGDGGWAVLRGTNPLPPAGGTIDLAIEEDQLSDSERNHTTEQVAYFVIDPPLPVDPMDINGDAQVTAADALRVINRLARTTPSPTESKGEWESLDVNQDGYVSALDALVVINRLSKQPTTQAIAPIVSAEAVDAIFAATNDDDEASEAVDQLLASTL